jgi:hypothetical protein
MSVLRPTRTARLLLALACCLGLLAPAGAAVGKARATTTAVAQGLAATPDDLGQALLRDRVLGPPVAGGARRDDRERPGPALPGLLAAVVATVAAWASRRRSDRSPRRTAAAAAAARAPPSLQPAPV